MFDTFPKQQDHQGPANFPHTPIVVKGRIPRVVVMVRCRMPGPLCSRPRPRPEMARTCVSDATWACASDQQGTNNPRGQLHLRPGFRRSALMEAAKSCNMKVVGP